VRTRRAGRLYAGFAVTPYPELWRRAVDGVVACSGIDLSSLLGAVALLTLLGAAGFAAPCAGCGRHYRSGAASMSRARRRPSCVVTRG